MKRKWVAVGIIFVCLLLVSTPVLSVSFEENIEQMEFISIRYFLFGRIDGWYWQNTSGFHFLTVNGSNYRAFGFGEYTSSYWFRYAMMRRGFSSGFSGYEFKGILTQRFICGVFSLDHTIIGNHVMNPVACPLEQALCLFVYHSVEVFKGDINNLTIEGDVCSFRGEDVRVHELWRYRRSWGFSVCHAMNNELRWTRNVTKFKGVLEAEYIKGFFIC